MGKVHAYYIEGDTWQIHPQLYVRQEKYVLYVDYFFYLWQSMYPDQSRSPFTVFPGSMQGRYWQVASGVKTVISILDGKCEVIWSISSYQFRRWLQLISEGEFSCWKDRPIPPKILQPQGEGRRPRNYDRDFEAQRFLRRVGREKYTQWCDCIRRYKKGY